MPQKRLGGDLGVETMSMQHADEVTDWQILRIHGRDFTSLAYKPNGCYNASP